jgi:hypothetical protein
MVWALQIALKRAETCLSSNFANFLHTSACLSGRSGRRQQPKSRLKGSKGKRDGRCELHGISFNSCPLTNPFIARTPSSGPSRKRLESFSKSRPLGSHIKTQTVISAPKNFGLRTSSPLYKAAEEETKEARSQEISKKRLAREQYAAEKHQRYEQGLSYQAYVERRGKRSNQPTEPESHLPRSKVGEFAVTQRPSGHSSDNLPRSFASPPLIPALLQGVREVLGSKRPSPVQALSLKYLFPPTDSAKTSRASARLVTTRFREHLLASETGSGKTIAYLLPLLQHLKVTENAVRSKGTMHSPRALVLAPTHELTRQLTKVAKSLVHTDGAKLRLLCSSKKNIPSSGVTKDSMKVTARKLKILSDGEFKINRDDTNGEKKQHPVDVIFTTPMRALEMVKGRGWDREQSDEDGVHKAEHTGFWDESSDNLSVEGNSARDRRGKLPEARNEKLGGEFKFTKEMELLDVEWVVVDEADVLFGNYFDFQEAAVY